MSEFSQDIYTEPDADINTLANLGPLRAMAGVWQGERGLDIKPKADGPRKQAFVERIELQPIDPVTNGPQLFYGLRYLILITKPGQVKTYHEQVGYWLWEPATGTVIQTLAIPRGQIAMASGTTTADATSFELVARSEADNRRIPHQGHHQRRRHLGLRGGHRDAHQGQGRALPPHRQEPAGQGRRADAEPAGALSPASARLCAHQSMKPRSTADMWRRLG